jgi:hypothetical protein
VTGGQATSASSTTPSDPAAGGATADLPVEEEHRVAKRLSGGEGDVGRRDLDLPILGDVQAGEAAERRQAVIVGAARTTVTMLPAVERPAVA